MTETMASAVSSSRSIPTPDFASYAWVAISGVEVKDDWIHVTWDDGIAHRFYGLWLWENTVGKGVDPVTKEMRVDPADLPATPIIGSAVVGADGELVIIWEDRGRRVPPANDLGEDRLHPGWLRSVANGDQRPEASLPVPQRWTAATWTADPDGATRPPVVDGAEVLTDDAVLEDWLEAACEFGLALLRNAPATESFVSEVAARVGPIRGTNFGAVFSVHSVINPDADENSLANTGLRLGPHSDLPTRETPPGFQLLHCVANSVPHGWATMTDGAAVMERLEQADPKAYHGLVTWPWIFANRSPEADHRWCAPMVELGESGRPLTMRCFYPVRAVPAMDPDDVPAAYAAMATFSEIARSEDLMIRFPYAPGDAILFDNRRILHGRESFEPNTGSRHLRGCYIDHDDVYSRLRVLRRARHSATIHQEQS